MTGFGKAALAAIAAASWAFAAAGALAQTGSPEAFLDGLYKPYLAKQQKGTSLASDVEIRSYFASPLADAIIKDFAEAAKRNEVPDLNGDPFVDSQDWQISNLAIAVKMDGADRATGTVTFINYKEKETVTLDLVRTPAGWRIAEIAPAAVRCAGYTSSNRHAITS